jgi:methane/ammonia monooxygenase subunit A
MNDGEPVLDRRFDLLFSVVIFLLIMGAAHVNNMLLAGDWSFWVDWKDRQWWPLLTPAVNMVPIALVQYLGWTRFRAPAGATMAALALVSAQWISRVTNFEWWANIPLNYTWPETMVLLAILMDAALVVSRSMLITSVVGGALWGGLFYVAQWPALAPFLQPVVLHGQVLTVADTISFETGRSQGPEYLRMIERGHLRALVGDVTTIVSFFAAMVSIGVYWIGVAIGHLVAIAPINRTIKLQSDT